MYNVCVGSKINLLKNLVKAYAFHGKELNTTIRDPVKTLTDLIVQKCPSTPREVIYLFCKTRLFIRLKHLNDQIKEKEKAIKKRYAMHVNKF